MALIATIVVLPLARTTAFPPGWNGLAKTPIRGWRSWYAYYTRYSQPMIEDVLEAMRVLIENILSEAGVGGESFMETSGLKLRELLVWQLVTGYKLRELEAKEELNKALGMDSSLDADLEA